MTTKTATWAELGASRRNALDGDVAFTHGKVRPAAPAHAKATETTDFWPRLLAVLLLSLLLMWGLFGKAFRSGTPCGWTVGQEQTAGEAHEFCEWFASP